MRRMLDYVRPFYARIRLGLFIKSMGTFVELLLPFILSHVLKNVVAREAVAPILRWGAVMAACAVAALVLNTTGNRMAAKVTRDVMFRLRNDLFARTLRLSASQTDRFTVPSLEARITTDTYHVQNFLFLIQRAGVRAPVLLIGGIAITLCMDAHLALVMIAVLPAILIVAAVVSRQGVRLFARTQRSVDDMIGVVREDAQGIRVI